MSFDFKKLLKKVVKQSVNIATAGAVAVVAVKTPVVKEVVSGIDPLILTLILSPIVAGIRNFLKYKYGFDIADLLPGKK